MASRSLLRVTSTVVVHLSEAAKLNPFRAVKKIFKVKTSRMQPTNLSA